MHIGSYAVGEILPLFFWCRTDAGTPVAPDTAPIATIRSASQLIQSVRLPAVPGTSGMIFQHGLFLGDTDYAVGKYFVEYTYILSAVNKAQMDVFELVAGGDFDGQGISMHFMRQPAGDFVLVQGMSGRVLRRKNPTM